MDNGIGAGIVTYNPDIERLSLNINSILKQVNTLVIIDNNSENYNEIEKIADNRKIILVHNNVNVGIGAALNQIVEKLHSFNMNWALLLDQDSIIDEEIIFNYEKYLDSNIGLLTPYIVDINKITLEEYKKLKLEKTSLVNFAITSGSLININICNKLGRFDESLFIDGIDTDYCRKLSINKYKQIRVNSTYILHEVGKAEKTFLYRIHRDNAGKFSIMKYYRTNHSLQRIYYMARNNIILTRRYKKYYSSFKGYFFTFSYMFGKILFEKRKIKVFKAVVRGIKDGLNAKVEVYKIKGE